MRNPYRAAVVVAMFALSASVYSIAQFNLAAQAQNETPADTAGKPPSAPAPEPTVTVLDKQDVQGILGKDVRSAADEDMGRIVDILVDQTGQVRAAIIDFGGFLGVGSRKIAVTWNALRFTPNANKVDRNVLEMTRDQVRAAPEYKEGKPVVVLGPSGNLESLPF
jgi:PRC-barrel domain